MDTNSTVGKNTTRDRKRDKEREKMNKNILQYLEKTEPAVFWMESLRRC